MSEASCSVIVSGILGYRLLEGYGWLEAVYMTTITLTTVGFQEVRPLTPLDRVFTIALLVAGVGVVLYTSVAVAAVALVLGGCARENDLPQSGDILYRRYCASCHGADGRGDGPAAAALSPPPADLTRVTSDIPELMRWIDGRRTVRAHGTAAMPVWGEVFEQSLIDKPHQRRTALLQVRALADYVHHLRERGR